MTAIIGLQKLCNFAAKLQDYIMWVTLALLSALCLGFYDVCKKNGVKDNAVIPVLWMNTLLCSILMLPFVLLSRFTPILNDTLFQVPAYGWDVHWRVMLKAGIVNGTLDPFKRKIVDQQGNVRNDGSKSFTPLELMQMDWLCENVVGSFPVYDEILPVSRPMVDLLGVGIQNKAGAK